MPLELLLTGAALESMPVAVIRAGRTKYCMVAVRMSVLCNCQVCVFKECVSVGMRSTLLSEVYRLPEPWEEKGVSIILTSCLSILCA